jgi:hypothetical protein
MSDAIDDLERQLRRAVRARAGDVEPLRSPRRWRRTSLFALAGALIVSGGALAATSLLSSGSPVPFERGAPIAGRAQGAPIAGTVRMLTEDVPDPGGGAPWGLRYWETDRKYACVQVGRVYHGKLGQISGGRVFHELRLGLTRGVLGGCFALDGGGHAFIAVHTDAQRGAQLQVCPPGFRLGATLRGPGGSVKPCTAPDRTIDFGLLGPNAKRYIYTSGGRAHAGTPLGGVGAYLVVQKRLRPVTREYGFHHRDPRLNLRGPAEPYISVTPASQVIKRVEYTGGTCVVHVTMFLRGACNAQAGFVPIPQPAVRDVRAHVRAFAAPDGRGIRVRFRARQAVIDGRSGYTIEVRPDGSRGFMTQIYAHDVEAGHLVRTTVGLYDSRRGPYRIVVRYRSVRPRPGPYASLAYPGLLVGQARVDVP